jgi:hypothetical protein
MAFTNISKPSGLSPVRYLNGTKYDGKVQTYCIVAANTNAFFVGDLVTPQANGDSSGIPAITLSAVGGVSVGVIVAVGLQQYGAYINPNALQNVSRPSGAQTQIYYAAVSDDPNIIYEIQEGGAGTNLTQTSCNRNANVVLAAPATGVAVSGTQIDNATVNTTVTLNLKLLRLAPRIDNHFVTSPATGGGGQKWWVIINNHYFRTGIVSL